MSKVEDFMSVTESERLHIIRQVQQKLLKPKQAAKKLGVCTRQIHRLVKSLNSLGPNSLISKKRGRSSHHKYSNEFRQNIQDLIQQKYVDFGPTLIAEMLLEREGLNISKETIRLWMIETDLWKQNAKKFQVHQPRDKRPCYGSLIQIVTTHPNSHKKTK